MHRSLARQFIIGSDKIRAGGEGVTMEKSKFGEPWKLQHEKLVPVYELGVQCGFEPMDTEDEEEGEFFYVKNSKGDRVLYLGGDKDEDEISCRRIVACINAMAGIDDPAKVVSDLAAANERIAVLKREKGEIIKEIQDLVSESRGVGGLHANGILATWDWLFESWLEKTYEAMKARAEIEQEKEVPDDRPEKDAREA